MSECLYIDQWEVVEVTSYIVHRFNRMIGKSELFLCVHNECRWSSECEEEHDFAAGMDDCISKLMLPVKHSKVVSAQGRAREWLTDCQQRQDAGERVSFLSSHMWIVLWIIALECGWWPKG